jgi:aminodeoxyfutalosine synthase
MGLKSNCTMLYGHVEKAHHKVDHLLQLRALQDETRGFQCFIPLAFHNENNSLRKLPEPTAIDSLRTLAVARLLLDNFDHIKAYWVSMGVATAQLGLRFGADDLDGTIVHESIYHSAGSRVPMALARDELVRLIREAGRIPVERDTTYGVIEELPKAAQPEAALKVRERFAQKRALSVVSGA